MPDKEAPGIREESLTLEDLKEESLDAVTEEFGFFRGTLIAAILGAAVWVLIGLWLLSWVI